MSKTTYRLYSFAAAAVLTLAMLGGIDHLAGSAAPEAPMLATADAPRA